MYVVNSTKSKKLNVSNEYQNAIDLLDDQYAKTIVESIAIPRHYISESENNKKVSEWISNEFHNMGLEVTKQGEYGNLVACSSEGFEQCTMIIGAHFDSVPNSPGADDNASAVAGMLLAASVLSKFTNKIAYIAFNREEDGLLGSRDFVNNYLSKINHNIKLVHILEMIGYSSDEKGSQLLPKGLPIKVSDIGDFLAIISNRRSNSKVKSLARIARTYLPDFEVKILKVFFGLEKFIHHLLRSDHSPFWAKKIPAMMWTDTSEFRNPHYHSRHDLPDTLDYEYLIKVTKILVLHCLYFINDPKQ